MAPPTSQARLYTWILTDIPWDPNGHIPGERIRRYVSEKYMITPDGAIVHADGTVIALDVNVVGSGDAAKEMIRRKTIGWGSLGALEKARRASADTWERVRRAQEDGVQ